MARWKFFVRRPYTPRPVSRSGNMAEASDEWAFRLINRPRRRLFATYPVADLWANTTYFSLKARWLAMPKQKTHKGMAKRFKVTASGKVTKRSPSRGHLQSGKTPKRKRQLRKGALLVGTTAKKIIDALRPGL